MSKKVQAIIILDDSPTYYFYDGEIEEILTNYMKMKLDTNKEITTELNSPALKSDEVRR